jgi:hypothetical protein
MERLTVQTIEAWNQNNGGKIKTDPPSPSYVDKVKKNLKKDPHWVETYCKAAPLFKDVDDSSWSSGRVGFSWSIRFEIPESVLSGGRRMKSEKQRSGETKSGRLQNPEQGQGEFRYDLEG